MWSRSTHRERFIGYAPVMLYYQGCFADLSCSVGIVGDRRCNQKVKKTMCSDNSKLCSARNPGSEWNGKRN